MTTNKMNLHFPVIIISFIAHYYILLRNDAIHQAKKYQHNKNVKREKKIIQDR